MFTFDRSKAAVPAPLPSTATAFSVWHVPPRVIHEIGPSTGGSPVRIGVYPDEAAARAAFDKVGGGGEVFLHRGTKYDCDASDIIARKHAFGGRSGYDLKPA